MITANWKSNNKFSKSRVFARIGWRNLTIKFIVRRVGWVILISALNNYILFNYYYYYYSKFRILDASFFFVSIFTNFKNLIAIETEFDVIFLVIKLTIRTFELFFLSWMPIVERKSHSIFRRQIMRLKIPEILKNEKKSSCNN